MCILCADMCPVQNFYAVTSFNVLHLCFTSAIMIDINIPSHYCSKSTSLVLVTLKSITDATIYIAVVANRNHVGQVLLVPLCDSEKTLFISLDNYFENYETISKDIIITINNSF